jgi:hypothetical protein
MLQQNNHMRQSGIAWAVNENAGFWYQRKRAVNKKVVEKQQIVVNFLTEPRDRTRPKNK